MPKKPNTTPKTPDKGQTKDIQVSVRLDPPVLSRLDHIDKYARLGRAEIIRRALIDYMEKVNEDGQLVVTSKIPPYAARRG